MKHDKKIYSRRLMNEAMRQIKLPGIIGTLLLVGVAFFSAIVQLFKLRENGMVPGSYSFFEMNPYIMLVMYAFVPLMVMMLFGFMNKRRASDFYHSLPYSRLCIYISFHRRYHSLSHYMTHSVIPAFCFYSPFPGDVL